MSARDKYSPTGAVAGFSSSHGLPPAGRKRKGHPGCFSTSVPAPGWRDCEARPGLWETKEQKMSFLLKHLMYN